ncbi:MAG TPA: hypothetical protein VFL80_00310, partial [Thermoanaerobaculia bacterium]|nr:hypothetical protein [Thermoanaerobaculia bacterium]
MEKRTNSPYPRIDRPVLAIIGVALVVSTVLFAWSDFRKDWRYYQDEFRAMVATKFGEEKAAALPNGIQQTWLPDLRRADRCITCHQAINWKGFETAAHPHKSHPPGILEKHPVEKFGCTTCHGGQGYAVTFEEAHGPIKHWEEPVLGSYLGEAYSLVENKKALMEMNCNVCH